MDNGAKEYATYQFAINELNKLQIVPSAAVGKDLRKSRIESTRNLCSKLDMKVEDIDKLNIIHVAGSKGKGSTSAFTESILRKCGYRTGLYSSPHLIEVRERMKINGESLSYKQFSDYFAHCHKILIQDAFYECESQRPIYFQFLTCMMFYVFLKEKIDVAVIEVGLGGEYDSTNVIKTPIACGITSLSLEHCNILGYTIEEIAWQKSGIFKNNSIGFTVDNHEPAAIEVLKNRAQEKKIPLCLVKPLDVNMTKISLNGSVQYYNAALALQLSNFWMQKKNGITVDEFISKQTHIEENVYLSNPVEINDNFLKGLESCVWLGRNQILKSKNPSITYYIDGAHTIESVRQYVDWYLSSNKQTQNDEKNVLLFNYTGDRNGLLFLKELLMNIDFDAVAFSKLNAYPETHPKNNADSIKIIGEKDDGSKYDSLINSFNEMKKELNIRKEIDCQVFSNIFESIAWLTNDLEPAVETAEATRAVTINNTKKINVLITGSLYLVGLSLKVLEQKVN